MSDDGEGGETRVSSFQLYTYELNKTTIIFFLNIGFSQIGSLACIVNLWIVAGAGR